MGIPDMTIGMEDLGWDARLEAGFAAFAGQDLSPGRVSAQHRTGYGLLAAGGEYFAEVTGRLSHMALGPADLPVVGDWVAAVLRPDEATATIIDIVPRRTWFSRQAAGERTEEQVIAANLDVVFIVTDQGHDYNPRRLERYLTLVAAGGSTAMIVLNKSDLVEEIGVRVDETRRLFPGVEIMPLSALKGEGVEGIRERIPSGRTGALVGSSGVGKSTLINRLLGSNHLETRAIRESDGKGRHTTSRRELIPIPDGGMLIDTPGMREVQLWADEESLVGAFPEIDAFSAECRFRDCSHESEPGCAVRRAVEGGELSPDRLLSYRKQQKEVAWHVRRSDPIAREEENKRIARLVKEMKRIKKRT